jgi:ribosome-associated protein
VLSVGPNAAIDPGQLVFKYSRSSGPGGQNVNKLNTRVTLFLDVTNCATLSPSQKKRILNKLATRADKNGVVRVVSQKYRTQNANRRAAIERLTSLIADALKRKLRRRKTLVPKWANQKRLTEKKKRSQLKKLRIGADTDD